MWIQEKLKSQTWENGKKTKFRAWFWPIWLKFRLPILYFFSRIWLCQPLYIMVSYHHVQYQKKLMTQSWDNFVTERRTEGRTDGREWFYRTMSTNVECTAKNVHITFKVRGIAAVNNRCMKYDNFIKIIKIFQRSFS